MSTERLIVEGRDSQGHAVVAYLDVVRQDGVTRDNVGATGTLTPLVLPNGNTVADATGDNAYVNRLITGGLTIRHNVTFVNCRFEGSASATGAGYTISHKAGTGKLATFRGCTLITKSAITKGIAVFGDGDLDIQDSLLLGGEDGAFLKTTVGRTIIFRRCFVGDLQGSSGSHADGIQIEGGGALVEACRIEGYQLAPGQVPGVDRADGSILANSALILTQQSSAPTLISGVNVSDCSVTGGNWTVDMRGAGGTAPVNCSVTGGKFGLHYQFGPLVAGSGTTLSDNVWAETGTTDKGLHVTAGQPLN